MAGAQWTAGAPSAIGWCSAWTNLSLTCRFHTCFLMSDLAAVLVEWCPHTPQLQPLISLTMCCSSAPSIPAMKKKRNDKLLKASIRQLIYSLVGAGGGKSLSPRAPMWWISMWRLTCDLAAVLVEW